MLEQLKETSTTRDVSLKENLLSMIAAMQATKLLITVFQESDLVKDNKEYKQLRGFGKEVKHKLDWFCSVITKIAGENSDKIEHLMDDDSDKINDIATAINLMANSVTDTSLLLKGLSPEKNKELLWKVWQQSRFSISPKLQLDQADFEDFFGTIQ